ncbi:MAG TPA: heterodisulfide reductase-related iron-sulfur binding cluster [Mycobacteriales bacterium]|nr:heterodisulfide reductase-related iron-sulfur binding cluster [Mycobacteriales bacterium]
MTSPISRDLVADCVHCGFCLPTCPTYLLWGEEMDSPRGRIYLMKQLLEGEPLDDATVGHFDACLGCMACVTACPSGVQYDALIEQTRAHVEERADRPLPDKALRRMIFGLFPYPRRLALLRGPLRAYQRLGGPRLLRRSKLLDRLPPSVAAMEELLPPVGPADQVPEFVAAHGVRRARVGMLLGCVQRAFFPGVNAATARVLAAEGCDVVVPRDQSCCGALSVHVGREDEARERARRLIATFENAEVDFVVINAAGCGSSMKEYARLLADDPVWDGRAEAFSARCRDLSELLVELGPVAPRRPVPVVAAYHDACHLSHAQGIRSQPRELLAAIPGLELRELATSQICCGSAGVYNLLNPQPAQQLGDRKAADVLATGADVLITANPGCLMQIGSALRRHGRELRLAHTAEVLDASIRGVPLNGSRPMTSGRGRRRNR